jgi:zinc protease
MIKDRMSMLVYMIVITSLVFKQTECRVVNIVHKVLSNGLTLLIKQNHAVPKVSLQLWYNVGSKDEQTGERGIAHLIEHMIFKGTKKLLSETDIKAVVQKLSGSSNAFTSYDYTGYMFDVPSQNWQMLLPIMADCMVNAAFNNDHLNSEMKAVIQELKMIKDQHVRTLAYDLLTIIFPDHPYHYPLIGYKQDLWSVRGEDLERFYKKHYIPNNATLVVVGDVDPDEVYAAAERAFGHIEPNNEYERSIFYHNSDMVAKSVTLYRDIQQPTAMLTYVIPGAGAKQSHVADVLSIVLSEGKNSRLYKKLVDELQIATSISVGDLDLFDYGLLMFTFVPKSIADVPAIEKVIMDELHTIAQEGISASELEVALKKAKMHEYRLLEQNQAQASTIAKYFLATGDPLYAFTYLHIGTEQLNHDIKQFAQRYLRHTVAHRGIILPLPEDERQHWLALQQESDALDDQIMSVRTRKTPVEPVRYADTISPKAQKKFDFPKGTSVHMPNGLDVTWYDHEDVPTVMIALDFKAKTHFDPDDKQGLLAFVARMMREGTKHYTAAEFAQQLESRGMSLTVNPGGIALSLLKEDLHKGLELMQELLTHATFPEQAIEKIREQLLTEVKQFWDEPRYFAWQLVNEFIYKGHPYAKNGMGTVASISSITRDDLVAWYKACIVPEDAVMAIVGDLDGYDVPKLVSTTLDTWQGKALPEPEYPALRCEHQEIAYPINRDQVMLMFAMPSVDFNDPDYDKLMLFDQIFGSGVLGSMTSRLFTLREATGLFYAISGSMVAGVSLQPGMVLVYTLVSLDNLAAAEQAILGMMRTVVDTITPEELAEAQRAVATALVNRFDTCTNIAQSLLFLKRYNLGASYFDTRAEGLAAITLDEVKDAVRRRLRVDDLSVLRIGRV